MALRRPKLTCMLALCAALGAGTSARGQEQTDEWTAYTSMRVLNDLVVNGREVWSATSGGALRYNTLQRRYTRYTRLDGLAGNQVLALAVDDSGHVWFGTDLQGLSRFRPEEDRFDRPYLDFRGLSINALHPLGNRIYVATNQGISVFLSDKEEVKETYRTLGSLPKDTAVKTLTVFDGKLWAGTDGGIAHADLSRPNLQDPDSWTAQRLTDDLKVNNLLVFNNELFATDQGYVWIFDAVSNPERPRFHIDFDLEDDLLTLGVFRGRLMVTRHSGGSFVRQGPKDWEAQSSQSFKFVNALATQGSVIWAGTSDGLRVLGASAPPNLREPAANQFFEMELLDDGQLWVASTPDDKDRSQRFGLYQFDGKEWLIHDFNTGLPSNIPVALETDLDDRLWVGMWNRGVAVRNSNRTWQFFDQTNSILQGIGGNRDFVVVSDIDRDEDGLMWMVNNPLGLAVVEVDDGRLGRQAFYDNPHISFSELRDIYKLFIARDGRKWILSRLDGFAVFDDGGTPFDLDDDSSLRFDMAYDSRLTSNRVAALVVDRDNQIWVGTDNGLNAVRGSFDRTSGEFDVRQWRVYTQNDGLPSNEINALQEDPQGNIWVGSNAGLTQIDTDGKVAFTLTRSNSGLIDDRVQSLFFDAHHEELWIGTFDGLSRFKLTLGGGGEVEMPGRGVYPNPFVLDRRGNDLTFAGLPLGASVRIFTTDGQLVRLVEGRPGRGLAAWDGRNQAGSRVSSGIYFFVAENEDGNRIMGKFAVIHSR